MVVGVWDGGRTAILSFRLRLHSGLRQNGTHLNDDETVAKMGHPASSGVPGEVVLRINPCPKIRTWGTRLSSVSLQASRPPGGPAPGVKCLLRSRYRFPDPFRYPFAVLNLEGSNDRCAGLRVSDRALRSTVAAV